MATWRTYKCKDCGYEVNTEPQGHYALMSGEYYNFSCPKCKGVVALSADTLAKQRYQVTCPKCGGKKLSTWNPIEGHCPKCNGTMEEVSGRIIMAD